MYAGWERDALYDERYSLWTAMRPPRPEAGVPGHMSDDAAHGKDYVSSNTKEKVSAVIAPVVFVAEDTAIWVAT